MLQCFLTTSLIIHLSESHVTKDTLFLRPQLASDLFKTWFLFWDHHLSTAPRCCFSVCVLPRVMLASSYGICIIRRCYVNVHSWRLQWAVRCGENLISFYLKAFVQVLGILKTVWKGQNPSKEYIRECKIVMMTVNRECWGGLGQPSHRGGLGVSVLFQEHECFLSSVEGLCNNNSNNQHLGTCYVPGMVLKTFHIPYDLV